MKSATKPVWKPVHPKNTKASAETLEQVRALAFRHNINPTLKPTKK